MLSVPPSSIFNVPEDRYSVRTKPIAIGRRLHDTDLLGSFRRGVAFGDLQLRCAELRDDLFRRMLLRSWHENALLQLRPHLIFDRLWTRLKGAGQRIDLTERLNPKTIKRLECSYVNVYCP